MYTNLDIETDAILRRSETEYLLSSRLSGYMEGHRLIKIKERVGGENYCILQPFGEQIKQSGGWLKYVDDQNALAEIEHESTISTITLNRDQVATNKYHRRGIIASLILSGTAILLSLLALLTSLLG